ncbi:MAG: hypothetical protein AB1734_09640, partial [Elusimicrobiota bacterium]
FRNRIRGLGEGLVSQRTNLPLKARYPLFAGGGVRLLALTSMQARLGRQLRAENREEHERQKDAAHQNQN